MLVILLKSIIIGGLVGFAVGAGAARMFHIPSSQGMGAFRTLGELNACQGDPMSHFSFGFGMLFNAWAQSVGGGCLTGDLNHRVIPNLGAAILLSKNKDPKQTLENPKAMALICSVVGMVVVAFLNVSFSAVPHALQSVAESVLVPAGNLLLQPVMPIVFWLAALDGGKRTGLYGTVFGALAQLVMGNSVPGIVLGILIGKGIDDTGWSKMVKLIFGAVCIMFVFSGFFRGFDVELLKAIHVGIPHWLASIHGALGLEVK